MPAFPTPYWQKILFIQIKLLGFTSCLCSWWICEPNSWIFLRKLKYTIHIYTYFLTKNLHCKNDIGNCEWHTWFSPDPLETRTPADFFLQDIFFVFLYIMIRNSTNMILKMLAIISQTVSGWSHVQYHFSRFCHRMSTTYITWSSYDASTSLSHVHNVTASPHQMSILLSISHDHHLMYLFWHV